MLRLAVVTQPGWFDWLTLAVTAIAAVVPAWIAIGLWRLDRKTSTRQRRAAAIREFTHLLATGDPVLVRFRDSSHFAATMGPGASALMALIDRYADWDFDAQRELEGQSNRRTGVVPEPRIDLSVDVNNDIARWTADPAYRAGLTEIFLANGSVFPAAEDNRIISPTTRRNAEDAILQSPRTYREWLAGTRLAPSRIRRRRVLTRFSFRRAAFAEPLNPLATNVYLEAEDVADDKWLRARTTATLEDAVE